MSNSNGPDLSPPSLCTSSGADAGNLGIGIGKSFLNLVGFGWAVKSPLDKLNERIKELQDLTQQVINEGVTQWAQIQNKIDANLISDITLVNTSLQNYVQFYNEKTRERSITNTVLISGCYGIVLIIVVFLLISNALSK